MFCLLIASSLIVSNPNQVSASHIKSMSYQTSQKTKPTSITNDTLLYSNMQPHSIKGYRKLGYSHFFKSRWSGTKNVMSTKTKRVAKVIAETVLSPLIVNKYAKAIYAIYTVSSATATQHPDVWPTSNLRNIMAKTPVGYTARIGQETIIKYYSNKKRTHLIKKIHHTYWFG